VVYLRSLISRWQISDLKRKFQYGVRARVRKGLHSIRLPVGYRRPPGREGDKTAVGILVPAEARTIITMKDMFLAGTPYKDIERHLNEAGVLTPGGKKWDHSLIKQVLVNPFYAGKVFFGRTRTVHDPHLNKTRLIKNPSPELQDGKHQALFTWEEHIEILAEVARRKELPRHNRYAFSGLLECSVCGKRLIHDTGYKADVWHCAGKHHTLLSAQEALALIPRALQKALQEVNPAGPLPSIPAPAITIQDLERQKKRIQQAFEAEMYSFEDAEQKIKQINAEIKSFKNEDDQRVRRQVERKRFAKSLEEVRAILNYLPQWVSTEEPLKVNAILRRLCQKIVVTPDGQFTIHFQG
jgi:recombinase